MKKKKGSVDAYPSTLSLERLSDVLGWDRDVCTVIVDAMTKSHSSDEVRSIAHEYGMEDNPAAAEMVERYIQARNFDQGSLISDEDLKAALYIGDNVKTTVKRRPGKSSSVRTLEKKVVNCLNCGKIFDCRQPGKDATLFLSSGGICTYCGKRVRLRYSDGSTNMTDALGSTDRVEDDDESSTLTNAIELRDRLLDYDRQSARRTTVIDDQSDYFEIDSNTWLTDEEKADLHRQKAKLEASEEQRRRKIMVTLDLLGRRVIMDQGETEDPLVADQPYKVLNRDQDVERAMAATREEAAYGGGTAAKFHQPQAAVKLTVSPSMRDAKYVFMMPHGRQKDTGKKDKERNDRVAEGKDDVKHFSRLQHDGGFALLRLSRFGCLCFIV